MAAATATASVDAVIVVTAVLGLVAFARPLKRFEAITSGVRRVGAHAVEFLPSSSTLRDPHR